MGIVLKERRILKDRRKSGERDCRTWGHSGKVTKIYKRDNLLKNRIFMIIISICAIGCCLHFWNKNMEFTFIYGSLFFGCVVILTYHLVRKIDEDITKEKNEQSPIKK